MNSASQNLATPILFFAAWCGVVVWMFTHAF
jgi:hypothetical protein